ncbi:MAG: AarF/ABC1/UbiB kinase family protein [Bdellovibrionales bacterium]|nr:AarF/ABC1/UbiB kinase family protein [Bdellovibrionales bacterium]
MPQKKEALRQIRTGILSRGLSLAKASIKASRMAAQGILTDRPIWLGQVESLIAELGQLKGTAMKVGQTLSMYGEHLLPKEVNELLKTLQSNSPPLHWDAILPILEKQLGADKLSELEIEPTPVASASIGQVHRARIKATGEVLAVKVQYPGVDSAVETDLKLLKFILNVSDLVPRGPRFDQVFEEIRVMFHQEINYERELEYAQMFYRLLKDDERYIVPKPYERYCTRKILTTAFIEGVSADSSQAQALPLERRNQLGLSFLHLYLRELFEIRQMQTDPHLGNYRIHISPDGHDRLVLFDFGAVRDVPTEFLKSYALLVEGGIYEQARLVEKGGRRLGLLQPQDTLELVKDYVDLCFLLTEPFKNSVYDWGASDLPKRVAAKVSRIAVSYKLRAPPRELVFLDRKLGGVFIFLSVLKCKMDGRPAVEAALKSYLKDQPDRFLPDPE